MVIPVYDDSFDGYRATDHSVRAEEQAVQENQPGPYNTIRLSLDEAVRVFLQKNFQLLVAKYGIQAAQAQQVTAGLFTNPQLSVGLFSSITQGCNTARCGAIMPQISQLFSYRGKTGISH